MSEPGNLLSLVENTMLAREPIAALARAAPAEELLEMLRSAVEDANVRGATVLALAVAVAGARIPAPLVMRIAPDLDDIQFLPPIVGAVAGDRMEVLLDLAATERLSWEREAVVLYLAARLLDRAQPPRRLTSRLRSLLREATSESAAIVAGMAAFLVDDPEVRAVAGNTLALGALGKAKGLDELLWNQFERPVLESLPEQEMHYGPTFDRGPFGAQGRSQRSLSDSSKR